MKDIFDLIEKVFGASVLKSAAAAVVVYFVALGIFKLAEGLRALSRRKRLAEHEKSSLEILKLKYEIEAIRKTHGLPELAAANEEARTGALPPTTSAYLVGWDLAWRLVVLLVSNIGVLVAIVSVFFIVRYALAGNDLRPHEWGFTLTALIIGLGSSYLSFWSVGPKMRQHSTTTFRVLWLVALFVATGIFIWGLLEQQV